MLYCAHQSVDIPFGQAHLHDGLIVCILSSEFLIDVCFKQPHLFYGTMPFVAGNSVYQYI